MNHPGLTGAEPACAGKSSWPWFALPVEREDGDHGGPAPRAANRAAVDAHHKAIATCVHCPILLDCLRWGATNEDHGVWGGLASWERKALGGKGVGRQGFSPMTAEEAATLIRYRFRGKAPAILRTMAHVKAKADAERQAKGAAKGEVA